MPSFTPLCRVVLTDLPDDSRNEHFCCVHSPDASANAQTRESDGPDEPAEEPGSDPQETTDDNQNTPVCDSINQSQPETDASTGSDITPGPVSEHGAVRRRNKQ